MVIRIQDKTMLVPDGLLIWITDNNTIVASGEYNSKTAIVLGTYSSQEKCIKVLDEITEQYDNQNSCIYDMPQDYEVTE